MPPFDFELFGKETYGKPDTNTGKPVITDAKPITTKPVVSEPKPVDVFHFDEYKPVKGDGTDSGKPPLTSPVDHSHDIHVTGSDLYQDTNDGHVIYGDSGDNWIQGNGGSDIIYGGDGNDTIYAFDFSCGGTTDVGVPNYIDGGNGNDYILGAGGDDILYGGNGNDYLFAGPGNNVLDGGAGDDLLHLGSGNDIVTGGEGHDIFRFSWVYNNTGIVTDFNVNEDTLQYAKDIPADTFAAQHTEITFSTVGNDMVINFHLTDMNVVYSDLHVVLQGLGNVDPSMINLDLWA